MARQGDPTHMELKIYLKICRRTLTNTKFEVRNSAVQSSQWTMDSAVQKGCTIQFQVYFSLQCP